MRELCGAHKLLVHVAVPDHHVTYKHCIAKLLQGGAPTDFVAL